jgi:hypothetical protein
MRLRNLFTGGAFALCLLSMFAAKPALADYTGSCADAPTTTITGNANIGDFSTTPAPFTNVKDSTGALICNGQTVNATYAGLSNSQIITYSNTDTGVTVGSYWFTAKLNDQNQIGYSELYAQALAYEAYSKPTGNKAYNVPDNVFANVDVNGNGFFTCVKLWADTLQTGSSNPAQNTSCGD